MRQVLTDRARQHASLKRGGGGLRVTLSDAAEPADPSGPGEMGGAGGAVDIVALDEALTKLAALDARQARIVELRYLAGLSVEETAEVLEVSPRTVKLDWQMARSFLRRELSAG